MRLRFTNNTEEEVTPTEHIPALQGISPLADAILARRPTQIQKFKLRSQSSLAKTFTDASYTRIADAHASKDNHQAVGADCSVSTHGRYNLHSADRIVPIGTTTVTTTHQGPVPFL